MSRNTSVSGSFCTESTIVTVIIGTRPEAIKMAPIVKALKREPSIEVRVISTGQHDTLVHRSLRTFGITVDYDLEVMKEDQSLYGLAERCLPRLRDAVNERKTDLILVQGDTASVFFASLVAFFEKIRVGHVESGLRTHDKWSPFPEEMFRRLSDVIADLHFAPTKVCVGHLESEGIDSGSIYLTGNTVVDAVEHFKAMRWSVRSKGLREVLNRESRLVVVTVHRRESFGEPIKQIFRGVEQLARRNPAVEFVCPVHPNPNVTEPAKEMLSKQKNVRLLRPFGYFDFLSVLKEATFVITDSGGIQEEAPSFNTPVLIVRDNTERMEGVRAGVARLVGRSSESVVEAGQVLLNDSEELNDMAKRRNPYGDGRAGERIADIIGSVFCGRSRRTADLKADRQEGGG